MAETVNLEALFLARKPHLFFQDMDSFKSSRQSLLSHDTETQARMYSRMLKQIDKEVS